MQGVDARLCRCHGVQMDRTGHSHECAIKRRARRRAVYHANPAADNYTRMRRALRARIEFKVQRIAELEEQLMQMQLRVRLR
jgi:hypothetical protein